MYYYLNARIHSMYGRLLDKQAYMELLQCEDLSLAVEQLFNSEYRREQEQGLARYDDIAAVEYALRENLKRNMGKLLRITEDAPRRLIKVLLARWDVQNIKSLLRGIHGKCSKSQVRRTLVPVGDLSLVFLEKLAETRNIPDLIQQLAGASISYARPLHKNFDTYQETGDLALMEYALDNYRLTQELPRHSGDNNCQMVVRSLQYEIDTINLLLCLKFLSQKNRVKASQYKKYLISGGVHSKNFFLELLHKKDVSEALVELATFPDFELLENGILHLMETGKLALLEREAEEVLIKRCVAMKNRQAFSIAITIAYIWKKYNEFVNLRLIFRGKSHKMSSNAIREELVFV